MAPFWQGAGTVRRPLATLSGLDADGGSLTDLVVWLSGPLGAVQREVYWSALNDRDRLLLASFGSGPPWRAVAAAGAARRARLLPLVRPDRALFQSWYMLWLLRWDSPMEDARWQNLIAVYSVLSLVQYGVRSTPSRIS